MTEEQIKILADEVKAKLVGTQLEYGNLEVHSETCFTMVATVNELTHQFCYEEKSEGILPAATITEQWLAQLEEEQNPEDEEDEDNV